MSRLSDEFLQKYESEANRYMNIEGLRNHGSVQAHRLIGCIQALRSERERSKKLEDALGVAREECIKLHRICNLERWSEKLKNKVSREDIIGFVVVAEDIIKTALRFLEPAEREGKDG